MINYLHGQARINQMYQHKIIRMGINITIRKRSKPKGKLINFDIEELRENPEKLKIATDGEEKEN